MRTRYVVIKRACDMKIIKIKKIHSPEPIFIIRNAISTGSAAFGAFGARFEEALEQIKWKGGDFYRHWS